MDFLRLLSYVKIDSTETMEAFLESVCSGKAINGVESRLDTTFADSYTSQGGENADNGITADTSRTSSKAMDEKCSPPSCLLLSPEPLPQPRSSARSVEGDESIYGRVEELIPSLPLSGTDDTTISERELNHLPTEGDEPSVPLEGETSILLKVEDSQEYSHSQEPMYKTFNDTFVTVSFSEDDANHRELETAFLASEAGSTAVPPDCTQQEEVIEEELMVPLDISESSRQEPSVRDDEIEGNSAPADLEAPQEETRPPNLETGIAGSPADERGDDEAEERGDPAASETFLGGQDESPDISNDTRIVVASTGPVMPNGAAGRGVPTFGTSGPSLITAGGTSQSLKIGGLNVSDDALLDHMRVR